MDNILYYKYLLNLLSNMEDNNEFHNELKVDIYLTLLSLNNHKYYEKYYQDEMNKIDNYLRKINNLKVKIQLKRKDNEIDSLISDIEELYNNNNRLINRFNKDNLNILDIIKSKDSKEITNLIDKLTKEKLLYIRNKTNYDNIRNSVNKIDYINYEINNNIMIIKNNNEDINILLSDFYMALDYLLNINNYHNTKNKEIVIELIDIIDKDSIPKSKLLVPIILNSIINKNINNYELINTSNFKIDNIKITDLYSLAGNKVDNINTAKWKKIFIPNNYLYDKIRKIINNGTYYYDNDIFILENIENNISDFKLSIDINNMELFIRDNLLNIINETTIV